MNKSSRKTRRVTANIEIDLLESACRTTGLGISATLEQGLTLVKRSRAADKARALKGKVQIHVDLEASRERTRH